MQGVKHPQLLDNRSSRESLAESAFAFPEAFEIEITLHSRTVVEIRATYKVRRMKAERKRKVTRYSEIAFGTVAIYPLTGDIPLTLQTSSGQARELR